MDKRIVFLIACMGSAGAAAQEVQDVQGGSEAVRISAAQERISLPPQLHNAWYDEFDSVAGEYTLSNKGRMALWMWGNRMYARVGAGEKVQLVAVSAYVFVGRERQMKIVVEDPAQAQDNRLHATVLLPARMLSDAGQADGFVQLLAQR